MHQVWTNATARATTRAGLTLAVTAAMLSACSSGGERTTDTALGAVVVADSAARMASPGDSPGADEPRADAPTQAVLDQLTALGPKPLETLTPAEARQQPTPKDAVMALLVKQGKDTTPSALVAGVTSVDRTVRGAAGSIPARVYTPS